LIRTSHLTIGSYSKYWHSLCDQTEKLSYKHTSNKRIVCSRNVGRDLSRTTFGKHNSEHVENLPFVFPSCIGKYVSYAIQCIRIKYENKPQNIDKNNNKNTNKNTNNIICSTLCEEIYRLNYIWKRIVNSWRKKYSKHRYFPVIRIHDSFFSKKTYETIGKALLLYEREKGTRKGIFFDGHNPSWISLDENQSFLCHIETIFRALNDIVIPMQTKTHIVSYEKKTPLIISNGQCILENTQSFIGMNCDEDNGNQDKGGDSDKGNGGDRNDVKENFDIMCAILFHNRYRFVRRKFRSIIQE